MTPQDTELPHPNADRIATITLDLLEIDTQNPPGHTGAAINYIEDFFEELGITTERIVADPAKPNLLATIPGRQDATLLYNGHVDTVPFEPDAWVHDPRGERVKDRLYGRGATDMKGPLAAMLAAAEAITTHDSTPPITVDFLIVSDEETGGAAGAQAVLEQRNLTANGCVIGETTCEKGQRSMTVADRGSIWLTLQATGTAAHGSRPQLGVNAITRLIEAVEHLESSLTDRQLDIDTSVQPIIEESVEYYGATLDVADAERLFTHPTVNVGTISGGEAINRVPASAKATLDIRLAPQVKTPAVLEDIRACVDEHEGVVIADASWSVGTATSLQDPLVTAVSDTVASTDETRVYRRSATGGGDAKKFRNAGVPTVEFAFGTETSHAPDEYIPLSALERNGRIYTTLPYNFAEHI